MAYEFKEGQVQFTYNAENEDSKYPAFKGQMKINGVDFEIAAWVRNGKYGKSFSTDAGKMIPFLKAMFGATVKKPEDQQDGNGSTQPQPTNRHVDRIKNQADDDATSLIR